MTDLAVFDRDQCLQFELGMTTASVIDVHEWCIIGKFDDSVLALFSDNLYVFSLGVRRAQGPELLLLEGYVSL